MALKSSVTEVFFSEDVYIAIFKNENSKEEKSSYIIHYQEQISIRNLLNSTNEVLQFERQTQKL